jgi:hypothetical protein
MKTRLSPKKIVLLFVFVWCFAFAASGQGLGTSVSSIVKRYEDNASRHRSGDTNVPLLMVNCFFAVNQWPGVLEEMSCYETRSVNRSGVVSGGHLCISNFGGERGKLSQTDLQLLITTMKKLPPPPTNSIPTAQKLLIGGIRSNQWFYSVYNRTNLPAEVQKLCEISGAQL